LRDNAEETLGYGKPVAEEISRTLFVFKTKNV
jgi:hypothetical protein